MKKNILSLLFTLFSIAAFAQHSNKDLLGKWEGTDDQNKTGSARFLDSNKVTISFPGGEIAQFTFVTDLPKSPAKIELTLHMEGGQTATLKGYLLFVDDDTIKWQIFPDGNRPDVYDENSAGAMLTFKRKKD